MEVSVVGVTQVDDRRRAEVLGRERLRLHVAGTAQDTALAVQAVGAGLGDDVQRGAGGPAEFGGERVREHRHFLNGAQRHGGDHRLAAPRLRRCSRRRA